MNFGELIERIIMHWLPVNPRYVCKRCSLHCRRTCGGCINQKMKMDHGRIKESFLIDNGIDEPFVLRRDVDAMYYVCTIHKTEIIEHKPCQCLGKDYKERVN